MSVIFYVCAFILIIFWLILFLASAGAIAYLFLFLAAVSVVMGILEGNVIRD
jgi:predicted PurR-regulated permease PerM